MTLPRTGADQGRGERFALTARAVYPAFSTLWLFVVAFWTLNRFSASRQTVSFERLAYPFISISFALYLFAVLARSGTEA